MLELIHSGRSPTALIMPAPDAILLLGVIVAREMGWAVPPAYALSAADQRTLHGKQVAIGADGAITVGG